MRTRAVLASLALVGAGVLGPGGPAAAVQAKDPHVTKAAYDKVRHGWKINRVHKVFGIEGRKVLQGGGYATRVYDGWTNCLRIDVVYHHVNDAWRLDTKKTWTDTDCVP